MSPYDELNLVTNFSLQSLLKDLRSNMAPSASYSGGELHFELPSRKKGPRIRGPREYLFNLQSRDEERDRKLMISASAGDNNFIAVIDSGSKNCVVSPSILEQWAKNGAIITMDKRPYRGCICDASGNVMDQACNPVTVHNFMINGNIKLKIKFIVLYKISSIIKCMTECPTPKTLKHPSG